MRYFEHAVKPAFVQEPGKTPPSMLYFHRINEILAGMRKECSDPREIEGRQALFVVNLAPRPMAGEISEGMLFDIGYSDGMTPALAVPARAVPNGVRAV